VRLVCTTAGRHFLQEEDLVDVKVYQDDTEWLLFKQLGDPVLHIEVNAPSGWFSLPHSFQHKLRKWADLMIIAPLGANTLAKLATGLCDNLLVRAFYW
jgi:phosphopantothenoylcysteine decarboxylase